MGRSTLGFVVLATTCGFFLHCVGGDDTATKDAAANDVTTNDVVTNDVTVNDVTTNDAPITDSGADGDGAIAPLTITPMVAIGYGFSCSLRATGRVYCWGTNTGGQLGNGATSNTPNPTPGQVSLITNAARISAGNDFVCAVLTDHTVSCWGGNYLGQLGKTFSTTGDGTPAVVAGLSKVMSISAGGSHVCALDNAGAVWCWGSNGSFQLGHDSSTDPACGGGYLCNPTPTKVAGLPAGIDQVAMGIGHSCAHAGTQAWCWGDNTAAQLGHVPGTNNDAHPSTYYQNATPVAATATGVAAVFAGGEVTCILNASQAVQCWGTDTSGQLGDKGLVGSQTPAPVTVSGVNGGTAVAPGWLNSCAIGSSGQGYCWGDNSYGGEGVPSIDGGTDLAVNAVPYVNQAVTIASNHPGEHHCAQDTSNAVVCWGTNNYGECGHANTSDPTCGGQKCVKGATAVAGLP